MQENAEARKSDGKDAGIGGIVPIRFNDNYCQQLNQPSLLRLN
jgi:hypothetical protein